MQSPSEMDLDDPSTLIGRTILIQMTYIDKTGAIIDRIMHHGVIADLANWIFTVESVCKEDFYIPYDKRTMRVAKKGIYRIAETGEEIVDPDITMAWIVERPGTPPEIN